jgi:hypothetical protein
MLFFLQTQNPLLKLLQDECASISPVHRTISRRQVIIVIPYLSEGRAGKPVLLSLIAQMPSTLRSTQKRHSH